MKFKEYYKKIESNKDDFEFEVSYLITELRLKFGLTQAELAKKIGTKQPSIARMERGAELPSLRILKKIADALKIKIIPPKFDFMTGNVKSCEEIIVSPPKVKTWNWTSVVSESNVAEKIGNPLSAN